MEFQRVGAPIGDSARSARPPMRANERRARERMSNDVTDVTDVIDVIDVIADFQTVRRQHGFADRSAGRPSWPPPTR